MSQPEQPEPQIVPLDRLRIEPEVTPRARMTTPERVALFATLYQDGGVEALPPLEGVKDDDGDIVVSDGHHRYEALWASGLKQARVIVLAPRPGMDPVAFAYERALFHSTTSALPLTRAEVHAAAFRLFDERSELTDREIARLTGTSHQTVGRLRRKWSSGPEQSAADAPDAGERYIAAVTADELADRLVKSVSRLWEARGLSDVILGDERMGRRLAYALREQHDDGALTWARRLAVWSQSALRELQGAPA